MNFRKTGINLALAAGLVLGAMPAFAATGTAAGTTISNTATINYSVASVAQTAINSNTATFLVDRSINVTVVNQDSSLVQVVPGQNAVVTTFKVTNNSNSTEDFRLVAANVASGVSYLSGTDNFDVTSPTAYVDSLGTGTYNAGSDTTTFIDELAAGATKTVFVVSNVPAGGVDSDVALVSLTAVAAQSTDSNGQYVATTGTLAADAAQTNTGTTDNPTYVDTVFADGAGAVDASHDGKYSSYDGYKVVTAAIAVIKSATVISDPINGTTNPKAIPGAVIEYCLVVNNTGHASATGIALTDVVPANTTYVGTSIRVAATAGSGGSNTCTSGSGTSVADTSDPSGNGGYNSGTSTITANDTAALTASSTWRALFRVTVN